MPHADLNAFNTNFFKELAAHHNDYDATIEALVDRYKLRMATNKLTEIQASLHEMALTLLLAERNNAAAVILPYLKEHNEAAYDALATPMANYSRNQQIRSTQYSCSTSESRRKE